MKRDTMPLRNDITPVTNNRESFRLASSVLEGDNVQEQPSSLNFNGHHDQQQSQQLKPLMMTLMPKVNHFKKKLSKVPSQVDEDQLMNYTISEEMLVTQKEMLDKIKATN